MFQLLLETSKICYKNVVVSSSCPSHASVGAAIPLLHENTLKHSNEIQREIEIPFIQEPLFAKLLKYLQSKRLFHFKELLNICSFLLLFIH